MRRFNFFALGALVLACAGLVAMDVSAQQEEQKKEQQRQEPNTPDPDRRTQRPSRADAERQPVASPNEQRIERLWSQVAQLHKQIVELELEGQAGATPDIQPARPGAEQPERDARDTPTTQRRDLDRQQFEDRTASRKDADLWKRLANVHRQLVVMEATETDRTQQPVRPRTPATRTTEPDRSAPEQQPQATPQDGERPLGQERRAEPTRQPGTQADSLHTRLLIEYAKLHQQIIQSDVQAAQQSTGLERRPATPAPRRQTEPNP